MALWSLLPSVAQFGASVINKPKKIKLNDKYLQNYLASLRGEKISGDVRQKALEAESKVIGKKTGRAMRTIQAGTATPEQKTQAIVDLYGKETEAVGGASDRASRIQEEKNAGIDREQRNIEQYIAKTKTQIEMQNELNEDQYKKGIVSSGIGLAANVAGKLGQDAYNKNQALQKGYEEAKASGTLLDTTTFDEYKEISAKRGFTDPAIYNKALESDRAKLQTKSFVSAIGEFAKTGELPQNFNPDNLSPQMQLSLAQVQAGETAGERKRIANLQNKFQQEGLGWEPNEGEDPDMTARRMVQEKDKKLANKLGFEYNDDSRINQINLEKVLSEASDELGNAMTIYAGNDNIDTKLSKLGGSLESAKDEGDKTKILSYITSLSTAQAKAMESGSLTRIQQNNIEKAKANLQIVANELDRVIKDVFITTGDENTIGVINKTVREAQKLIRSDEQVSEEQFQQLIDTIGQAAVNLPQTLKEKFLMENGYDPKASIERFQNIWTNKISKDLSTNLAATGRLTEAIDPFAQYEVVK